MTASWWPRRYRPGRHAAEATAESYGSGDLAPDPALEPDPAGEMTGWQVRQLAMIEAHWELYSPYPKKMGARLADWLRRYSAATDADLSTALLSLLDFAESLREACTLGDETVILSSLLESMEIAALELTTLEREV